MPPSERASELGTIPRLLHAMAMVAFTQPCIKLQGRFARRAVGMAREAIDLASLVMTKRCFYYILLIR